ncbi:NuA4-domain-containing protein [Westerdykella ornata]|uniref:Chromatin modification-related protein EAF6 n=1 Tax=Westerdykella ornata TaxID=318751 RepID=A0A6A6JT07_WESOR|nr:NuA4-domain-containing protein [Westerdykella ornata]KAF2278119.1 NuA4-domain-containing protein [Westerdykella ornata]
MTENIPPSNGVNSAAPDASRGLPYYEKLRRDLRESLHKKRQIDAALAQIEETILARETAYLEETAAGNIIKGFDNYIKGTTATTNASGQGTATRRKAVISDHDRIFSRSSMSLKDSLNGTPQTTPSTATTPASSFPTRENSMSATNPLTVGMGSVNKKKKKAADDDDSESQPSKRGKITYGRSSENLR